MKTNIENDLRERTKRFALNTIPMFTPLPKTTESTALGKQVLRSGTSVGANYREAYRSRSRAEFIAKAGDCLKELEETAYWLELLVEDGLVPEKRLVDMQKECNELTAIFVTIIKRTKENTKQALKNKNGEGTLISLNSYFTLHKYASY
jgi:four helix bundle protein